jgi:hypothetical protein
MHDMFSTSTRPSHAAGREQALIQLLHAYEDAVELNLDVWQLALQLPLLRAEGVSDIVLRRLVAEEMAAHAVETTQTTARQRSMRQMSNLQLSESSCFVLTEKGLHLARGLSGCNHPPPPTRQEQTGELARELAQHPCLVSCENGHRELWFANMLVKRFSARAENQELVLQAFQEQCWTRRIHDPIPPRAGLDSKRRLHDTITRLNRGQRTPLLRFHGDGSGQAVYWDAASAPTLRHHFDTMAPVDNGPSCSHKVG